MRLRPLLVLLVVAAVARAEAPLLSEREALETARRALRERRWDDAIAAFAQADKSWPGPRMGDNTRDPRSKVVEQAIEDLLAEKARAGAPASAMLPWWDFYVREFPFFSTGVGLYYEPIEKLLAYAESAAVERRRQADPKDESDAFAPCRLLAKAEADPEAVLALLERDWPIDHQDFGLCAVRAFRALEAYIHAGPATELGNQRSDRAWKAYAARFAGSPFIGLALARWGFREGRLDLVKNDPLALRWVLLGEFGLDPEETGKTITKLSACSRGWLPPALAAAWQVGEFAAASRSEEGLRAEAFRRVEEMRRLWPRSRELGRARYALLWEVAHEYWSDERDWIADYLETWRQEDPDDPWLAWGQYQVAAHHSGTWHANPLTDADRAHIEGDLRRFPGEAIAAYALCLLAEDDVLHRHGDRALERFRRAFAFDVGGVKLPGPEHADGAVAWARDRLQSYARYHDPSAHATLLESRPVRSGPFVEGVGCGNALQAIAVASLTYWAADRASAGRVEDAVGAYERLLRVRMDDSFPGLASDYVSLCLRVGKEERIRAMRDELKGLAAGSDPTPGYYVKRIDTFLQDLARARKDGIDGAAALLAEAAASVRPGDPLTNENRKVGEAVARTWSIVAIVRSLGDVDARCAGRRSLPATNASVLLACAGDTDASLEYLIDAFLSTYSEALAHEDVVHELAGQSLVFRGRAAASRILVRIGREGARLWPAFLPIFDRFDAEEMWRACEGFAAGTDPVTRDLARMVMAHIRSNLPWLAYCLGGE